MNKLLLPLFACVLLTADGQEEWRKEGSVAALPHPDPTQDSSIPKGNSENVTHKREKRMPDTKQLDDGSFGYAWNVGNGMSYMKIHVGKSNNPVGTDSFAAAQHQVINSLRADGDSYQQKQNDKTDYERLHKDLLKTSQQIATQKNKNLSVKPGVGPKTQTTGVAKQELNFDGKNIASFAFDKEQKKANEKLQDFNAKLKHEYDKFNSEVQFSRLPQHQPHSLRELNVAQNIKQSGKGDYESGDAQVTLENKPINGFVYNNGFLKNQHHFAPNGNLYNLFKTIEVPWQESSNNYFAKGKEANTMESDENTFKEVNEQKAQNVFNKTPGEALSTQNIVSEHQTNVEDSEHKPDHEETSKTGGKHVQKSLSEIPYNPQIEMGSQGNNGYGNKFINEMHPEMNQKLINEQVEKIKQIQQEVIETHFPGPGIYSVLDGNAQHGFTTQGHPMHSQGNIAFLKQEESRGIDQSNTRLAFGLQGNREVMNTNYHQESTEPNVATEGFSSLGHGHSIVSSKSHRPFIINNAQGPKFMQNQFFSGHEIVNNESGSESHVGTNDETHWRPLRYTIKPKNEHQTHLQNGTYEPEKLKNEDSLNWNDGRKGREIKTHFEHEDSIQTHIIDDHAKGHFYGSEEHEEAKISHAGGGYPQFHKYPHQEPHVRFITKAVPVHKELKIPVPQMVRHPILIPVPYKVLEPYPIKIPVPVTVEKTVEVPVEKVIHYPVEKPVPVKVIKKIKVPVPKPYPVKVPVYKIKYVHHNKKKHE